MSALFSVFAVGGLGYLVYKAFAAGYGDTLLDDIQSRAEVPQGGVYWGDDAASLDTERFALMYGRNANPKPTILYQSLPLQIYRVKLEGLWWDINQHQWNELMQFSNNFKLVQWH